MSQREELDRNGDVLYMVSPKGRMFPQMPLDDSFDHLSDEELFERFDVHKFDLSEDEE